MTSELLGETKTEEEMTIVEWLNRLNCIKYVPLFLKKRVFFVSDLRFYSDPREWGGAFSEISQEDN